jgi:putative endonuclease
MAKTWSVYILECSDGSFYTGITNNLEKRMKAHSEGKGSKYVNAKGFKQLLNSKQCKDKIEASKYEYEIKQLPKTKKLQWFDTQ